MAAELEAARTRVAMLEARSSDGLVRSVEGAVGPIATEAVQTMEGEVHALRLELDESRFREREASGAHQQAQLAAEAGGRREEALEKKLTEAR
eukprot:4862996-Prymnesium_polylepis.1